MYLKKKIVVIKKECNRQKKKFTKIEKSLETQILIVKNEKDLKEKIANLKKLKIYNKSYDTDIISRLKKLNKKHVDYENIDTLKDEFFIGTIDEIREKIKKYSNLGVNHFMFWPMDFPESYTIDKLINKIA